MYRIKRFNSTASGSDLDTISGRASYMATSEGAKKAGSHALKSALIPGYALFKGGSDPLKE